MTPEHQAAYWRRNLAAIVVLLAAWAAVSYGASILLAGALDRFHVLGLPLGFWFATQGSILTFVLLVLVYVQLVNRLDRRYGVYED